MLFQPRSEARHKRPEGYIFTLPPRSSTAPSCQPAGAFLRARRGPRESEYGPIIFLPAATAVVLALFAGGWFLLALVLGIGLFLLHARFAYVVEEQRRLRPGQQPPSFLRVILPRFPALLVSIYLIFAGYQVSLLVSSPWTLGYLPVVALGVSVALFIGKTVQWGLDEFVRRRVSDRGSSRPGPFARGPKEHGDLEHRR